MLTQLCAHPLQVAQIVSHGVREVHKNIKVQRAFGWSKHFHIHQPLLSWQKTHAHLLWRNLGLLKARFDFFLLKSERGNGEEKLQFHSFRFKTATFKTKERWNNWKRNKSDEDLLFLSSYCFEL